MSSSSFFAPSLCPDLRADVDILIPHGQEVAAQRRGRRELAALVGSKQLYKLWTRVTQDYGTRGGRRTRGSENHQKETFVHLT